MKTKFLFISVILIIFISEIAEAQITFQKTFGGAGIDEASYIQQTNDTGYIIVGSTASFGAGSYDIYLIKTNANGDSLWTKTFGGQGGDRGKLCLANYRWRLYYCRI